MNKLGRLVSPGQRATEQMCAWSGPMAPSPGDQAAAPEARSGGLAGVFRGLTLTKSSKSAVAQAQPAHLSHASNEVGPKAMHRPATAQLGHVRKLRDGTAEQKMAAAQALRHAIADYPLNPVLDVWYAAKELIEANNPSNVRAAGWELLTACTKHLHTTDLERKEYFQTMTAPAHRGDFHFQLGALQDLTAHGRDVGGFWYDIFPLLTYWLGETYRAVRDARKASRLHAKSFKGKAGVSGESKNWSVLFGLIKDVIKFNSKFASETAMGGLLAQLLEICENTSSEGDLKACIGVVDVLVTYGSIPNHKLKECVHLLGTIHSMVASLQKDAWHSLSNICRSHHGNSTVRLLLDALRTYPMGLDKDADPTRSVRGALSVLQKLLTKSAEKGYPSVPLALLIDGLNNMASLTTSARLATDVLQLINSLFDGPAGTLHHVLHEEHWSGILAVAARCAATKRPAGSQAVHDAEDTQSHQVSCLIRRMERLLTNGRPELLQRDECVAFLMDVHRALPDSAVDLVLDHMAGNRSCFPFDGRWKENLRFVVEDVLLDRRRRRSTRLRALAAIMQVCDFLDLAPDAAGDGQSPVARVLVGLRDETDTAVLQETVTFLVQVAREAEPALFGRILDALGDVAGQERTASASMPQLGCPSLENVAARGLVRIFMHAMNTDAAKAGPAFAAVVHVAQWGPCATDARLTSLKMLVRLRADCAGRLQLVARPDAERLAASLYRTEASLARKRAEDAAQSARLARTEQMLASRVPRGGSMTAGQAADRSALRVSGGSDLQHKRCDQLWCLPDAAALPTEPWPSPSPVLFSQAAKADLDTATLDVGSWLAALTNMLGHACEWEVCSFVLVHLPAQLANQPLLTGAMAQVHDLRRLLCDMVRNGAYPEPPSSAGLRRTDVANCMLHSLTMLLSYHGHFAKPDQDELVRTFMHGLTDKTAKTCIHALSVCAHELPMATARSLVTILQRMSQVITQPLVAMHILEFLACLGRLHSLHSNMRDDEFRIVFAICFRYLQYVRDRKRPARANPANDPSSAGTTNAFAADAAQQTAADELPQYVYALAYHVIIFWFLALKVADRPNHVGWIAKNLFTDTDGSPTNEEQAQITADFLQRVAYSDTNDSDQDATSPGSLGDLLTRRWILGNSIITVRQARTSGWADIVRRFPSGNAAFWVQANTLPKPAHQARGSDGTTILPSHVLLQLFAPLPQRLDALHRPIPLPNDEAVERAMRTFDRNSTVDGHKIGVIYVGDGQTAEAEILANTIGSPDYHLFLRGLGTLTRLKGTAFNMQGLDRGHDTDGEYTYCWRDRVTEIVFHVTTQMPTRPAHDPQCTQKKKHIGNDFVNIIFNDSGLPFRFDTFPSAFNYVHIVVTPSPRPFFGAARAGAGTRVRHDDAGPEACGCAAHDGPFFAVHVMSRPGFPQISPAAEPKLVSLRSLPGFVRLLALNASVFSLVWANRAGGEHVSSWRNRLREINRLRDRYQPPAARATPGPPSSMPQPLAPAPGSQSLSLPAQPSYPPPAHGGASESLVSSRPSSCVRDSFNSLRRSSVATFFTTASSDQTQPTSHRSSMQSSATASDAEAHGHHVKTGGMTAPTGADSLVDSMDFTRWA